MNYLQQITTFWRLAERVYLPVSARLLFLGLLEACNRVGWQNPFFVSAGQLETLTGMAEKTQSRARQVLASAGLIEYSAGQGRGKASAYFIKPANLATFEGKVDNLTAFAPEKVDIKPANLTTQININKSGDNSLSDIQEKPAILGGFTEPEPERENPAKEKETAQEGAPAKKAGNGAILDDNVPGGGIPHADRESAPVAIFQENNSRQIGAAIPTLAQVEAEQRAKGYQLEAARFYKHFAPDWKTASGEPVKSWRKLYAYCEKNGLFDRGSKAPKPYRDPDRCEVYEDRLEQGPGPSAVIYEERMPAESDDHTAPTSGNDTEDRLDLEALERELLGSRRGPADGYEDRL